MSINFTCSDDDRAMISDITDRFMDIAEGFGEELNRMDVVMDITATHCNGCPLRLEDMMEADDLNLAHDVGGIGRYLNRETGKLEGYFRPRFAQPSSLEREEMNHANR